MEDLRGQDIIDSRDVIERLDELQTIAEDNELSEDEQEELEALQALCEEGKDLFSDWVYGEGLIADHYFVEYAQNLAEDIGVTNSDKWPNYCIDWEYAARELKHDYSSVEFGGVTYWGRS